jgi:hypothetical protein
MTTKYSFDNKVLCRQHHKKMASVDHHSHDQSFTGGDRNCPVGTPTSEMNSVPLPKWAESGKVNREPYGEVTNKR